MRDDEVFVIVCSFAAAACLLGAVYALAVGNIWFVVGLATFFVLFVLLAAFANGGRGR